MKTLFYTGFILLLSAPLQAETYSWVDGSGTYNFTEDYSKVPKKYQKRVKRREDIEPQLSPESESKPGPAEKTEAKPAVIAGGEKALYGGKSRAAWRKELDVMEVELGGIEQRMEQLRKQLNETKGITKIQFDLLKKEYDDNRASYVEKYKSYTELIEKVRKAGIVVDMKK